MSSKYIFRPSFSLLLLWKLKNAINTFSLEQIFPVPLYSLYEMIFSLFSFDWFSFVFSFLFLFYFIYYYYYYYYYYFFICSEFCHTLKWNSHGFTCVPHPDPPSHLPLPPLPLGFPSAPGPSACLMHPTWAGDLFHAR